MKFSCTFNILTHTFVTDNNFFQCENFSTELLYVHVLMAEAITYQGVADLLDKSARG